MEEKKRILNQTAASSVYVSGFLYERSQEGQDNMPVGFSVVSFPQSGGVW